eukprot:SAG31_NODE_177_length_21310_cov_8.894064_4_plen_103_part_00
MAHDSSIWDKKYDPHYDRNYYVHRVTGDSTWVLPAVDRPPQLSSNLISAGIGVSGAASHHGWGIGVVEILVGIFCRVTLQLFWILVRVGPKAFFEHVVNNYL